MKSARAQGAKVVSRQIPQEETDKWSNKLRDMEDEVDEVLQEEKEERALSITERDLKRGENLITHEDEIKARPRRTWFESEKDKVAAHHKGAAELNGPNAPSEQKKKKKLSGKDRKKLELHDVRTDGKVWKKGKEQRGMKVLPKTKDAAKSSQKGGQKGGAKGGSKVGPKGGPKSGQKFQPKSAGKGSKR